VVDGLVRGHKGAVEAQSTVGKGSTFTFYLPAAGAGPVVEKETPRPPVTTRGGDGQRLLVLDDDRAVLETMCRVLRKAGYLVDAFADAEEAIAAFEAESESYRMMITDRTMPRLSGLEVARRVFDIDPALPIILLTGAVQAGDSESPGISAVVAKPVAAAVLLETVARACATRSHSGVRQSVPS
jgi:CheY-like chemotaxis protein